MSRRKSKKKELSMRKVREILRLAISHQRGHREIACSCSISPSTVGNYVNRIKDAGLTYAQIKEMDDDQLKELLAGTSTTKAKDRSRPQPDWEQIHKELRKKGVTLQLLWEEYKQVHPDGYQSTQFCEH